MDYKKRVNVRLTEAQHDLLEILAERENMTKQDVIRALIQSFPDNTITLPPPPVGGLDEPLPGSVAKQLEEVLDELHMIRMNMTDHIGWFKFIAQMTITVGKMVAEDRDEFLQFMRKQRDLYVGKFVSKNGGNSSDSKED